MYALNTENVSVVWDKNGFNKLALKVYLLHYNYFFTPNSNVFEKEFKADFSLKR